MSKRNNQDQKADLALALATGGTVKAWAESVQLQAARAVLADLMSVSNYAALERRLTEIERRIGQARPTESGALTPPG